MSGNSSSNGRSLTKPLLGALAILVSLIGLDVVDSDVGIVVVAGWLWFFVLVVAGVVLLAAALAQTVKRRQHGRR